MEESLVTPVNKPSDLILELLIRYKEGIEKKEEEHQEFSITLNVAGMLITGDLISYDTYLKDFLDGAIAKAFQTVEKQYKSFKQEMEEIDKEAEEKPHNFIHLKNAKFIIPGQPPVPGEQEGTLWRGRLSSVDGFVIGKLAITRK
jgi:hypothetical protein